MSYSFQFRDVFAAWDLLLDGLILTLELSIFTMLMGLAIGIAGAAARVYGPPWLRRLTAVYVETIRNTPLMLATSVVSQISAEDLFHAASIIQSRTFRDFEVYILVAGAYLALAMIFRLLFAALYQLVFARR